MVENKRNTLHAFFSSPCKRYKDTTDNSDPFTTSESYVQPDIYDILEEQQKFNEIEFLSNNNRNLKTEERYKFLVNVKDKYGVPKGECGYDETTLFIPYDEYKKFTDFERQFWDIKKEYYDTIIFFKKGKFYELYENDAEIASMLFDLKIVDRVNMKMAGVPEKSYEYWAGKFLENGYKVGRVDQLENMIGKNIRERESGSRKDKIIKRELKEIITTSTIYNEDHIKSPISIYLAVIEVDADCIKKNCSYCYHVSILLYEASINKVFFESFCDDNEFMYLKTIIAQNQIREVISSHKFKNSIFSKIIKPTKGDSYISFREKFDNDREYKCFNYLINYMKYLKRDSVIENIEVEPIKKELEKTFSLSSITLQNMDIFLNNHDLTTKHTLFKKINNCITAAGQRLLKLWLLNPLKDLKEIIKRQNMSKALELIDFNILRSELKNIGDIERIIGKCNSLYPSLKDVILLIKSLEQSVKLYKKFDYLIQNLENENSIKNNCEVGKKHYDSNSLEILLLKDILNSFPNNIDEVLSDFYKNFYYNEDEIMPQSNTNDELCALLEKKEEISKRIYAYLETQKKLLKADIKFKDIGSEVFQMEVENDVQVPIDYIMVSSTKSAKRFYTAKLRSIVNEYIECEELIFQSKENLLKRVISFLMQYKNSFYGLASLLAKIDVLISFIIFSKNNNSTFPIFGKNLKIKSCRNPVHTRFIENDLDLSNSNTLVLTGPNMGGKSTLLRTVCYNIILGHIGMKVCADEFETKLFDNIFIRMGANDNLEKCESTFMVELSETAKILKKSTKNTFVIIDELGRGTSISDGEAIAKSVLEYLNNIGCTLFFATHYHKMIAGIEGVIKGYMNYEISNDNIIFHYKLVNGISYDSHGISVAKMANVPIKIIERAKEIRKIMLNKY